MNYIDIILGIILVLAAINGYRKGLIVELASLAALILGIWGAIKFSYLTSDFLTNYFQLKAEYLNIISFIVTFIVIVVLVHLVGKAIQKIAESILLGFANRLAGLIFGILKVALILSVVLVLFDKINNTVNIISKETKSESRMYEPIRSFAPSIFPFIENWNLNLFNGNDKEEEKRPEKEHDADGQVV